jgi:hypothetical protein
MNRYEEIIKTLDKLCNEGTEIYKSAKDNNKNFSTLKYQSWYTKSLNIVKQLCPERFNEFISYYRIENRKEINLENYSINDYLRNIYIERMGVSTFNTENVFIKKLSFQVLILLSVKEKTDFLLSDIKGVLKADLLDNEIKKANELLKNNYIRASGVILGVVLESHLKNICENHNLKISKKSPTLSDFNDIIKSNEIIDVPNWRWLQRLGDIRNLCAHAKDREPTKDEVLELLDGTKKVITTIF